MTIEVERTVHYFGKHMRRFHLGSMRHTKPLQHFAGPRSQNLRRGTHLGGKHIRRFHLGSMRHSKPSQQFFVPRRLQNLRWPSHLEGGLVVVIVLVRVGKHMNRFHLGSMRQANPAQQLPSPADLQNLRFGVQDGVVGFARLVN